MKLKRVNVLGGCVAELVLTKYEPLKSQTSAKKQPDPEL